MKNVNCKIFKDTFFIKNLKLSSIHLINNSNFPWIILIPNRKNIKNIHELKRKDQIQLIHEISYCSKILKKIYKAKNINVEKIGNFVNKLHVHIIARSKKDSSWPLSVWVVKQKEYSYKNLNKTIDKLKSFL